MARIRRGFLSDLEATTTVRAGDILAGKYRIDKVLGKGGMGVVVAAHHIHLDEKVAIKFLLPETLGNQEAVTRFAREARAAVKIKSEHVARVSDVGTLENGAPYMVMEFLEGGDLADWVRQRGALPTEQAVEFVLQASEAIAEAHALGIVHRDLKPANLFVVRRADGLLSVKVLDFGISKLTGAGSSSGDASITKTSNLMGSPLYMSPEQMQSSKHVDARSDIWALGVILYELLAGEPPFTGETLPELVLQIMSSPPAPLRNKRPDAPNGLEGVLLKAMDKDRGRRFQTIAELATALLPFAPKRSRASVERISGIMRTAGFGESALALPPSSDGSPAAARAATGGSWTRTAPGSRRNSAAIGIGLGIVVLILTVGGILAYRSVSREATEEPSASPVATAATVPSASASGIEVVPSIVPVNSPPSPPLPQAIEPSAEAAAPGVASAAVKKAATALSTKVAVTSTSPAARTTAKVPAVALPPAAAPAPPPAPAGPLPKKKPSASSLIDDRY